MQTYEIVVQDRAVKPNSRDMTLVRTSVGIDQIRVLFDNPEWLEFPITVTFGHGDDLITQAMAVTELEGSEWAAEAYVTIPWEVIDENGEIRVTFQGTDSQGRHIITAKGAPLRVEEAGDVDEGDVPSDAPTLDQYRQAYADVISMLGRVQEAMEELEGVLTEDDVATVAKAGIVRPDGTTIVIDANGTISVANEFTLMPATTERLGGVMPDGTTVTVDPDGTLHSSGSYELPKATRTTLGGITVGDGLNFTSSGRVNVDIFTEEEIEELTPFDETVIDGDGIGF